MWILMVVVWTLSNGQMHEHVYRAESQYQTQSTCVDAGRLAVQRMSGAVPDIAGAAFMCLDQDAATPPRQRGEYDALESEEDE